MNLKTFIDYHFSWKLTLLAIVLSAGMLTAAKWQWNRYHEKQELLLNLKENTEKESVNILELKNKKVSPFTKVYLLGSFDNENEQLIINRRHKYGSGSWLMTPFRLENSDEVYMVSRGFIPFVDREPEDLKKYHSEGVQKIFGLVRNTITKRNPLSPSASGIGNKSNQWLYPDIELIQEALPYKINTVFFIQEFSKPVHGNFPAEDISIDVPPSTHFWYTFEWIGLAFFTCFISFMVQLFRPKKPSLKQTNTALSLLFLPLALLPAQFCLALENPDEISQRAGIIERSGNYVSLDIELTDETGRRDTLGNFIEPGKPFIIAPVYFECPRLCTLTQEGLLKTILNSELKLGRDYQVFSISFNHLENSGQAKERSEAYQNSLDRQEGIDPQSWKFMVGTKENVEKLMDEIGFKYEYDKGEYMHAAGIIMLNSDGLIARYLYGIEFNPRDFKLGLLETAEGKLGSFLNQALMFCFRYDHIKGQYTLAIWNIIRILSTAFVIILIGFLIHLRVKEVTKKNLAKSAKDL